MTQEELDKVLANHKLWINRNGGKCANLSGANLSGYDLIDANMRGTNMIDADMRGAYLIDADLSDADLRGADLSDADILCVGNMREIKTLQFEKWAIGYTHDTLQIGCQRHSIDKWRKWNTDAGRKWIAQMDKEATSWSDKYLDLVLSIIDASPATK